MTISPVLRNARGLTLVEILTALFVLSIGLAGVISIMVRSQQMGVVATDRNNASVIVPEAIKEIERAMLIDDTPANRLTFPGHIGEFMDTADLNDVTKNPFASATQFRINNRETGTNVSFALKTLAYIVPKDSLSPDPVHSVQDMTLCYWPLNPYYGRVMGQFPQPPPRPGVIYDPLVDKLTPAYRGLFKLEPHPDWVPNPYNRLYTPNPYDPANRERPDSAYVGIYVLTFTLYRDLTPSKDLFGSTTLEKKLQQVADPVVIYLRDRKVRQ